METLTASPAPATAPRNGYGTTALVVGIIGLVFCWVPVFGIVLAGIAILFGFLGLGRVKRGEATNHGHGVAGVVLGSIAALIGIIVTVATFSVAAHTATAIRHGDTPSMSTSAGSGDAVASRTDPASPIGGDGTYTVPDQMTPGTWQSAGPAETAIPMCYHARLSNLSGDLSAIKASDLTKGQATVTIAAGDAGFTTSGCSPWTKVG
jgi:hypothetical protein